MSQSTVPTTIEESVRVETAQGFIEGALAVPEGARGVVLFAHGSGSSRHSPRNRFVAAALQERRLGTLLIDLLTPEEERVDAETAEHRFDIPLLSIRLRLATDWLLAQEATRELPIGYFGASTGAAAALMAAARQPAVSAVVSRGGRPDLAGDALRHVRAATLLIVGDLDYPVIPLNREALAKLEQCAAKEMTLVTDATHLFEETGALEEVARLAGDWFSNHLGSYETANRR